MICQICRCLGYQKLEPNTKCMTLHSAQRDFLHLKWLFTVIILEVVARIFLIARNFFEKHYHSSFNMHEDLNEVPDPQLYYECRISQCLEY